MQAESNLRMDGNKLKAQQLNEAYRVFVNKKEDLEVKIGIYLGPVERGQFELPRSQGQVAAEN